MALSVFILDGAKDDYREIRMKAVQDGSSTLLDFEALIS
jgi:hypothetical protein